MLPTKKEMLAGWVFETEINDIMYCYYVFVHGTCFTLQIDDIAQKKIVFRVRSSDHKLIRKLIHEWTNVTVMNLIKNE